MEQESPIQALDTIDIVGKLRDGGLDLVIVADGYVDSSSQTMSRLEIKLRSYLNEALNSDIRARYRSPIDAKISVVVRCIAGISQEAMDLIARVASAEAADISVTVDQTAV